MTFLCFKHFFDRKINSSSLGTLPFSVDLHRQRRRPLLEATTTLTTKTRLVILVVMTIWARGFVRIFMQIESGEATMTSSPLFSPPHLPMTSNPSNPSFPNSPKSAESLMFSQTTWTSAKIGRRVLLFRKRLLRLQHCHTTIRVKRQRLRLRRCHLAI